MIKLIKSEKNRKDKIEYDFAIQLKMLIS
uniref:Uncharacterized protein n=1 Tax=Rhizophora mucronata TaxID=61149 RepID=A0A2P2P5N2_RHIMU